MASESPKPQESPPSQTAPAPVAIMPFPPGPYQYPPGGAVPYMPPFAMALPTSTTDGTSAEGSMPQCIMLPPPPPGVVYMFQPPMPGPGQQGPFTYPVTPTASDTKPKRRQVKQACTNCAQACKRCDDARPCQRCVKYGIASTCKDGMRKERQKGIKRGPYKRKGQQQSTTTPPDEKWPQQTVENMPQIIPGASPEQGQFYPIFYPPPPGWPVPPPGVSPGSVSVHDSSASAGQGAGEGPGSPPVVPPYFGFAPMPYPGFPPFAAPYPHPTLAAMPNVPAAPVGEQAKTDDSSVTQDTETDDRGEDED